MGADSADVLDTNPSGSEFAYCVRLIVNGSGTPLPVVFGSNESYYAVYDRIAPATNKYMATLFNTSATRKAVIREIYCFNWQFAAVTGVILEQYLVRITARTTGTGVTIRAEDTADSVDAGITADTNSSVVTEDHIIKRTFATSEEIIISSANIVKDLALDRNCQIIYQKADGTRGITLRQNQGISIRNVTNSAIGTVSYLILFTDEAV